MKRRIIVSLMAGVLALTSTMPVFAAPKRMADGAVFDSEYYVANNPDVAAVLGVDETALYSHYVNFGKNEGRKPCEEGAVSMETQEGDSAAATQSQGLWKLEKVRSFDVECFYLGRYTELIPAKSNSTGRWQYYNHNFELQFELPEYMDGKKIIYAEPGRYIDGVALTRVLVETEEHKLGYEVWLVDSTPKVVANFGDAGGVIGMTAIEPGIVSSGASHAVVMRNAEGLTIYSYHKDSGLKSVFLPFAAYPELSKMNAEAMMTAAFQLPGGYFTVRPLMADTLVNIDLAGNVFPWSHSTPSQATSNEAMPITCEKTYSEFSMGINYDMINGNSNRGNCLDIKDSNGNLVFRAFVYPEGINNERYSYAGFVNGTYLLARPFESRGMGEYNLYRLYKE